MKLVIPLPSTRTFSIGVAISLALFLLAGGCSTDQVGAPMVDEESALIGDLDRSEIPSGMAASKGGFGRGELPGGLPEGFNIPIIGGTPWKNAMSSTVAIDGAVGGMVSCGRFAVYFPPGAFDGVEEITVTEQAGSIVQCKLDPHGLNFDLPAILKVDLRYTSGDDDRTSMFWFDPNAQLWVDLGGSYKRTEHAVSGSRSNCQMPTPWRRPKPGSCRRRRSWRIMPRNSI